MLKNKRILAIVMTLMMVFSMMPGMAFADDAYVLTFNNGAIKSGDAVKPVEGETVYLVPELTGLKEGETFHIHWAKGQGQKKAFYFVGSDGKQVDSLVTNSNESVGIFGNDPNRTNVFTAKACLGTKDNCTFTTLATASISGGAEKLPEGAYTFQGIGRKIKLVMPSPIETVSNDGTTYINKITTKLNAENEIEFVFKLDGGDGGQFVETEFKESGAKKIFIYDESGTTTVASVELGNMTYMGQGSDRAFTMSVPAGTLEVDTNYIFAFDKTFANKTAEITSRPLGVNLMFQFTTAKADFTKVTVDPIVDQTYTGSEIKPAVVVKDGETVLTEGTDYTVEYKDNIEVGTATVTITGAGKYEGTKDATFVIKAAPAVDKDQNTGDSSSTDADKAPADKTTQTGDDMNMGLYLLIMMIAMAVASGAVVYKRQRQ